MTDPERDPPKIFVDEDWKTRVAAEKEAIAAKSATRQEGAEAEPVAKSAGVSAAVAPADQGKVEPSAAARSEPPAPPATLSFLITTLATQAMVALGEMTHPLTNKSEVRLTEARHFIDVLDMLEEKTAGNRSPEESALLDAFLHQLRLAYVERMSQRPLKN